MAPGPGLTHGQRAELPAGTWRGIAKPLSRSLADLAARVGGAVSHGAGQRATGGRVPRPLRRAGGHVPVRGARQPPTAASGCSSASRSAWSEPSSPGMRRCHGHLQARAGPAGRVAPSILKASPEAPGRGLHDRRGGRAGRPSARRHQRPHRRPGGVRAAGARSPGRQDHFHRLYGWPGVASPRSCGERIARCTLELGGKSAAVILDDADLATAAAMIAGAECFLAGQVCASLTRLVVSRRSPRRVRRARWPTSSRKVKVGNPFDEQTQMGPLAAVSASATGSRATSRRASTRARRWSPAVAARRISTGAGSSSRLCSRRSTTPPPIAREEIFGPVLSVIPAADERDAVRIANDTIYGLNASVFTPGRRPGPRGRRPAPLGHGRPQRLPHRFRDGVRRVQAVRHRSRRRARRPAALPGDEDDHPQRGARRHAPIATAATMFAPPGTVSRGRRG